jgi:hypothetical protein
MGAEVLTDPDYRMPAVPPGRTGVGWLRASVARFVDGPRHDRRRALVLAELAAIDPEVLARQAINGVDGPIEILAEAFGLPAGLTGDVELVAACYQPHTTITPAADDAVGRLITACGGVADEATANRIGLLVQASRATIALVNHLATGHAGPPVPATRRIAPDGTVVRVDLTEEPFGRGPHACPGEAHARAIASGLVERARS